MCTRYPKHRLRLQQLLGMPCLIWVIVVGLRPRLTQMDVASPSQLLQKHSTMVLGAPAMETGYALVDSSLQLLLSYSKGSTVRAAAAGPRLQNDFPKGLREHVRLVRQRKS